MLHKKKIFIGYLLIITVFAFYCYNPFALYFQNDDFIHIPLSAKGILLQHNTFRPVCDISIMFDYWLWGKHAWGYHFTNLLLHTICCILLYFFSRLLIKRYFNIQESRLVAFIISTLFFIYAMHSEAVFWILGRSAILASICSLLFLYCYLEKNKSTIYVAGYILFFVAGLLTYESCWVLPIFCMISGISDVKNKFCSPQKEIKHLIAILFLFIIYLLIRKNYIHEIVGNYEASAFLNNDYTALLKNYSLLIARSFIPAFTSNKLLTGSFIIITLGLVLSCFKLSVKYQKTLLVFFLCFLISIVPFLSLGIDSNGTEGERFLYLPTMILCIVFVVIITLSLYNKFVKGLMLALLMTSHSITLFINSTNYRFAGGITKSVVDEMEKLPAKKNIHVVDLPQSQYGALIFRTGFPDMIHWMIKNGSEDSVIICSQRNELNPLQNPFTIKYSNSWQANCSGTKPGIDSSNAVLLRFTDSVLYITK